jgi:hypothetical protein
MPTESWAADDEPSDARKLVHVSASPHSRTAASGGGRGHIAGAAGEPPQTIKMPSLELQFSCVI